MIKTAKRLQTINEYIFSHLGKEVKKVEEASGRKVLNFGAGNPDVKPSARSIQKFKEFADDEKAHLYPGYGATQTLSEALIHWYAKRFTVTLEKDNLLPLLGAKDGIAHLTFALFDEGDEVLVPDPGYPPYTDPARLVGAIPVFYDLPEENNFKLDLSTIEKKLSNKTKAIWVNFPSNTKAKLITLQELEALVTFAKKHNIIILYDNAYSEITFDEYVAPSILGVKGAEDIAIEFGSFSKSFSFAGFRMGWVVGNKEIIAALAKVKTQMDSGVALPIQKLGAYALTHFDEEWHNEMIAIYQQRRNIIAEKLKTLGLSFSLPKATLYIWAKIPEHEKSAEEFCMRLLREKQILFTPGTAFGKNGERYVRVSIGTDIKDIEEYFK